MSKLKLTTLATMLIAAIVLAQAPVQKTEVIKQAIDNPTIGINAFNGPKEAREKLESMLALSGWFNVLPENQAGKAQILLQAAAGNTQYAINLQAPGHKLELKSTGQDLDYAARDIVDQILAKLFNVQAFCTTKIAYVQPGRNDEKEICSIFIDNTGFERLTKNVAISTEPNWGHAGALVYTLAKNNALHIILMDIKNKRQRIISSARGLNSSAALSRNGQYVALSMSFDNQVDLYAIDLATNNRIRMTRDKAVESSPCWSPDGSRVCFVSDMPGIPKLYVVSLKGEKPKRLPIGGGECVSPDWSHVSNKICYAQKASNGQYVIGVIDMGDPNATPEIVTLAAGNWEAPSWAPDGRHIVCTRETARAREITVVDTWLRTFKAITGKGQFSLPAWQPAR
jgi:TolB protein